MPSLNLDLDYFSHPKVVRLASRLGAEYVCMPIKLWCYVGKYHCASGILKGYSKQEIEKVLGWTGPDGLLVDTLVEIRFLEFSRETYRVHDWKEHSGHLHAFKKRAKTASKARWKKHASSIATGNATSNAPAVHSNAVHSNAEEEKKEEEKKARRGASHRSGRLTDDEFLASLKANPAYAHIDLNVELGKMDAWLSLRPGKQKTRRFIVNWLNRIDKPVSGGPPGTKLRAVPPPFPPATDPIARSQWRQAYGDPKAYGY